MTGRLFVPLAGQPYAWFASGKKTWELRAKRGQFTEKHITLGRRVELRRGYSTPDSLWGTVADAVVAPTIRAFFEQVPFREVLPEAKDLDHAVAQACSILGKPANTPVIGFKVCLDQTAKE